MSSQVMKQVIIRLDRWNFIVFAILFQKIFPVFFDKNIYAFNISSFFLLRQTKLVTVLLTLTFL